MTDDALQTMTEEPGAGHPRPAESAYLYAAFACPAPLAPGRHALVGVDSVLLGRGPERTVAREVQGGRPVLHLTFTDQWMSGRHARLEHSEGRWMLRDLGSRNGFRLNGHVCTEPAELEDGDFFELGRTFFVFRAKQQRRGTDLIADERTRTLVPELEEQWERVTRLAASGLPVLIQGPPGVGKELAARELHGLSGRRGELVALNCGSLPRELAAGLLEGHERAVFTGADRPAQGLVRAAEGGMLLLDEVGELPESLQAVLLRVLAERAVLPLGAARPVPVDFRLVSATNRDLPRMVQEGHFRADLYGRLHGVDLVLPPLHARREDLGLLSDRLARGGADRPPSFEPAAARVLFQYDWPGNIRQLQTALRYAVVLAAGEELKRAHLPPEVLPGPSPLGDEDLKLREKLVEALTRHQGNESAVARELSVQRMTVWRWRRRLRIDLDQFR